MKHYGYAHTEPWNSSSPEWAICAADFKRQWPGGKIPSPLSRRMLGLTTVSSVSQAKTLVCYVCGKTLDVASEVSR